MEDKSIRCTVEVDELRKTITDPKTGKDWPIYFEEPEDFEVISRILTQLYEECSKRNLPMFCRVVRAHRPTSFTSSVVGVLPGPRAPKKMHALARTVQRDDDGLSSFSDLLKKILG